MNSNTFHSLHKTSAWATNILKLYLFFGKDSPTEQTIFLFRSILEEENTLRGRGGGILRRREKLRELLGQRNDSGRHGSWLTGKTWENKHVITAP